MKNSRKKMAISLGLLFTGVLATGLIIGSENIRMLHAENESCNHDGYHYAKVDPNETTTGHREFWTCCECHKQFLAKPRKGTFVDAAEGAMVGGLSETSPAYLGTASVWDGTNSASLTKGAGTADNPYLIESAKDFAYFRIKVNQVDSSTHLHLNNFHTYYYKLMTNINLNNKAWAQIGNTKYAFFSGHFDGNGYSILNLNVSGVTCYGGLFGYCVGAEIKNLSVSGTVSDNSASGFMTGMLAGVIYKSEITNCKSFGSVSSGTNSCGGLIGKINNVNSDSTSNFSESKVTDCVNYASAKLNTPTAYPNGSVGGIVGDVNNLDSVVISNCENYGTISGGTACGGIVGRIAESPKAHVLQSKNYGTISGVDLSGGIVGMFRKATSGKIDECINYGDVSVTDTNKRAGGIVGIVRCPVTNTSCANDVKINGTQVSSTALIGANAAIAWQVDSVNGGSTSNCGLCLPL